MKTNKSLASLRNAYEAAVVADRKAYRALQIAERNCFSVSRTHPERKRLDAIADRANTVADKTQRELERAETALLRRVLAAAPAELSREVIRSFLAFR